MLTTALTCHTHVYVDNSPNLAHIYVDSSPHLAHIYC